MTNKVEHSELGKHPEVIKRAQQDLLKMDVLVCGSCLSTFHFVKDFEQHKENCTGTNKQPDIRDNWAFQLWKAAQPKRAPLQSEWKLYREWTLLTNQQQAAWVSAGQSIQSISRVGQGAVQEAQVRVVRTVPDYKVGAAAKTPLRVMVDTSAAAEKKSDAASGDSNATPTPPTPIKRYIVKRTMNTTANRIEVRELPAEKITSRRLNPKRNTYEYFVTWAGNFESTWEPKNHFEKALDLIEETDRKLTKQKLAAAAASSGQQQHPTILNASVSAAASPGRPVRNSKARALDQVKQWCNTGEEKAAAAELKRKNADSDYAEAEDSSQDESMGGGGGGAGSPTPRKQMRLSTSPQLVQKVVGGNVRYYQKNINGGLTPASPKAGNAADVVYASSTTDKTGVMRKPGVVLAKSPTKREAQVRVIGKNETTSSGIVRIGAKALPASPASPVVSPNQPRMQKVIQTTRLPGGQTVKRTVYRPIPNSATPSPVAAAAASPGARPVVRATPQRQYQIKGTAVGTSPTAQQPQAQFKVSPGANRLVRAPIAKPLGAARVVRSSPSGPVAVAKAATTPVAAKSPTGNVSDSSAEMTLCPVTGKLISKGEAEGDELGRMVMEADAAAQEAHDKVEEEEAKEEAEHQQQQQQQQQEADTQISQLIENEDGSPVMITGDDGTIYQVAGKNAEGQTLLIAQGADGEQPCVFVAATEEGGAGASGEVEAGGETGAAGGEGEEAGGGATGTEGESGEETQAMLTDGDSQDGQITAQLVEADEPSADGTRRVVLLLPDGTLMVSEVNEEQYEQFNLGA